MIADKLKPPYYAVIFTSLLTDETDGYIEAAQHMATLAKDQEGYLGLESAREKIGITVSYWDSLEAITKWKNNLEHTVIRGKGRATWYKQYQLRICKVEREYGFKK